MKLKNILVVALFLGSLLVPVAYYFVFGFSNNQIKTLLFTAYEATFVVPGVVNILIIILLLNCLLAGYVIFKKYTIEIVSFFLYFISCFLPLIIFKPELYKICIIILIISVPYSLLYIIEQITKKIFFVEEKYFSHIQGLFFGISFGSTIAHNLITGYVVIVFMLIYFLIVYKVKEVILSKIKSNEQ